MKNKLFILLCMTLLGQSIQITTSSYKPKPSQELLLESDLYNKYTKISDFIIEGLDFFQASHAYEQNLNLQQALSEAQKGTLDSLPNFKRHWPKEFDDCYKYTKEQEEEYLSMAAYLKLGLTYPQAKSGYEKKLTIAQAMLLTRKKTI